MERTGKSWATWFALLDEAGATRLTHKEIVAVVREIGEIEPWWAQMVTVVYEQERGLRERHQKRGGYEISRSRTIAASAVDLFAAWSDPERLAWWLEETGIVVRRATPHRAVRMTWNDGATVVEVRLVAKGEKSTAVTVQHMKLLDAEAAEVMKEYWGRKLEILGELSDGERLPAAPAGIAAAVRPGKTIAQKLQIRKGSTIRFIDPPEGYRDMLGPLPDGVIVVTDGAGDQEADPEIDPEEQPTLDQDWSGITDPAEPAGPETAEAPTGESDQSGSGDQSESEDQSGSGDQSDEQMEENGSAADQEADEEETIEGDTEGERRFDMLQIFVESRADLERILPEVKSSVVFGGSIWITYPKGASKKKKADISRDMIAEYAASIGLEGVAIISVDDDWSALRVIVR